MNYDRCMYCDNVLNKETWYRLSHILGEWDFCKIKCVMAFANRIKEEPMHIHYVDDDGNKETTRLCGKINLTTS
jgi:hypothetical protein